MFSERMTFWNMFTYKEMLEEYAVDNNEARMLIEIETAIDESEDNADEDHEDHGNHDHGGQPLPADQLQGVRHLPLALLHQGVPSCPLAMLPLPKICDAFVT